MHTDPLALLALAALAAAAHPAEAAGARSIAAAVQPFVDSHSLAGAVLLVADREKVLDTAAVGFADVAARKPMAPDALFWIASQLKPMTATALPGAARRLPEQRK